jgi:hypothetical protein
MKPQIRLIKEKTTSVIIGFTSNWSANQPIREAMAPMKNTYIMYLMVVASALKVHLALAKKDTVTAMQKATKLENDCGAPFINMTAKMLQ